MELTGDLFFDFESAHSWRLFLLLIRAEQEGVAVGVEWLGLPVDWDGDDDRLPGGVRALAAHAAVREPVAQRRLREALFTLVHRQGDPLDHELTYRAAARVAGMDGDVLLEATPRSGLAALRESAALAERAGVEAAPSLVRHGPPMLIELTAAVEAGPARPRIEVLDRMLADDGLWRLAKP